VHQEKHKVAFSSVCAAVILTAIKIIVALVTGSLGMLSEAAHSALDLGATIITLLAVRISGKPADEEHPYGHGKIESFSALIEVLFLLITCGWIVYEALQKLFFGEAIQVENIFWGILVIVICITVDISRSRALKRVADKYDSLALHADALHFSSDVWSSMVVLIGLLFMAMANALDISYLRYADPIAALCVSIIVVIISIKLAKQAINVLLDTAPKGMHDRILEELQGLDSGVEICSARARLSGEKYFIEISIGVDKYKNHQEISNIVDTIRSKLHQKFTNSDILVTTFPIEAALHASKEYYFNEIKMILDKFKTCTNVHNISVYDVQGKKFLSIHIEIKDNINLKESHELSHEIRDEICKKLSYIDDVSIHLEYIEQSNIEALDITDSNLALVETLQSILNVSPKQLNCHDIKIYKRKDGIVIFLHCGISKNFQIDKIQSITNYISDKIRKNVKNVADVHVHTEPIEH